MTRTEDNDAGRRARARHMALLLGLFAVGLYVAYIVFWAFKAGA